MAATPTDPLEVDAWLDTLHRAGHLHSVRPLPGSGWAVRRTADSNERHLHGTAQAMEYITGIVLLAREAA